MLQGLQFPLYKAFMVPTIDARTLSTNGERTVLKRFRKPYLLLAVRKEQGQKAHRIGGCHVVEGADLLPAQQHALAEYRQSAKHCCRVSTRDCHLAEARARGRAVRNPARRGRAIGWWLECVTVGKDVL